MSGFALHTWTLDTTALGDVLRLARATGWDAVELRRIDFLRAIEAGGTEAQVFDLVRASGLPVACVGAQSGWMFADGEKRRSLVADVTDACRRAAALGSATAMSPADTGRGPVAQAAAAVREAGDVARAHGVRLALEAGSQSEQFNTLARVREVLAAAGHPSCGLLIDSYHLQRCGGSPRELDDIAPAEVAYVQFSDVPPSVEPGKVLDRLPAGKGVVPFKEFFAAVAARGYRGYLSYEAPNQAAWARPAEEVSREALGAARAQLPR
jgi:sugar phosphate isomerase/epimerase